MKLNKESKPEPLKPNGASVLTPTQLLQGLFDSPVIGIAILDSRLRYVAVNGALAAAQGVPADQLIGRSLEESFGGICVNQDRILNTLLSGRASVSNLEICNQSSESGPARHWEVSLLPLAADTGETREIIGLVVETTRERQFERCLRGLSDDLLRIRDQLLCLGIPDRPEQDKVRWWRASINLLDHWVREMHALAPLLQERDGTAAYESPAQLGQFSLPYFEEAKSEEAAKAAARGEAKLLALSARELEVLKLLAEGNSNKQVAAELGISQRTVETHRSRIFGKLQVHSIGEVVRFACQVNLVSTLR